MSTVALEARVLVLNKSWIPIDVKNAYDAVCEVFTGNAEIIDENYVTYDFDAWIENWTDAIKESKVSADRIIRAPSCDIVVPSVIRCKNYAGHKLKKPRLSRKALFARDNYTCQYCGCRKPMSQMNIDHVIPKYYGGKSTWENLVLSCMACNSKKRNRTPEEAGMKLIKRPKEPHWSAIKGKIPMDKIPKTWEDFLGKMYWNVEITD